MGAPSAHLFPLRLDRIPITVKNTTKGSISLQMLPFSDLFIQAEFFQLFCQRVVHRLLFVLAFHIRVDVPLGCASGFIFRLSLFKDGQFLPVAAYTCEGLAFALAAKLHFLMTVRTAGVCFSCQRFPAAALTILTYEHRAAFAVDFKHHFAAIRAGGA